MSEPKFKVGDYARVTQNLSYLRAGDLVTIEDVNAYSYCVKHNQNLHEVNEAHLEKVHIKEIKRLAKPGEYVKIVNASGIPALNNIPTYKNGDIIKIIENEPDDEKCDARYKEGKGDAKIRYILYKNEYVVLEIDESPVDEILDDDELVLVITSTEITVDNEDGCGITYAKDKRKSLLENISDALEMYSKELDSRKISVGDTVRFVGSHGVISDEPELITNEDLPNEKYLLTHYAFGCYPSFLCEGYRKYKVLHICTYGWYSDDVIIIEDIEGSHAVLLVFRSDLRKVVD